MNDAMSTTRPVAQTGPLVGISFRRIAGSTALSVAGRLLNVALGIAVAGILARSLGVAGFGELSLALALVGLAGTAGDFGATQVAVRDMASHPERRAEILGALVAFRLLIGTASMLLVIGVVAFMLPDGSSALMGILVAASIPFGAVSALQAVAQARLRPERMTIVTVGQSVVWLALVALLASRNASQAWYGGAFLIAAAAQAALAWAAVRHLASISWRPSRVAATRLLISALPLGLSGLFVTAYYRIDGVLLFQLKGAEETAFYAAAYRFLDVLQLFPATALTVLLPLLSIFHKTGDARAATAVRATLTLLAVVALPIVAGGMLLSDRLIGALYGSGFQASGVILTILLPAFLSICLGYVFSAVMIADGLIWPFALVTFVAAFGNILANILLIPHYGARAAAAVTVATEFPAMSAIALLALRKRAIPLPWARWARAAIALAPMCFIVLELQSQSLGLIVLAGGVVYLTSAFLFGALRLEDARFVVFRNEEVNS